MKLIHPGLACAALVSGLVTAWPAYSQVDSGRGASSDGGAGSAKESFKSDLFSGGLTNSIPLLLPAGTAGMQPSLALSYHSRSAITWVGRGWDLSIPSISRMTKFGVPSYSDEPQTGDLFALAGDRLVRDDDGLYRTMRENFDRIQRVNSAGGGIDYWILHSKDGKTHWFGGTADSEVVDPISGKTYEWCLRRVEDSNGNVVTYEYYTSAETGDDGAVYPKKISYSFRGDESPTSATIRTVSFTNGDRPDKTIRFNVSARRSTSAISGAGWPRDRGSWEAAARGRRGSQRWAALRRGG